MIPSEILKSVEHWKSIRFSKSGVLFNVIGDVGPELIDKTIGIIELARLINEWDEHNED